MRRLISEWLSPYLLPLRWGLGVKNGVLFFALSRFSLTNFRVFFFPGPRFSGHCRFPYARRLVVVRVCTTWLHYNHGSYPLSPFSCWTVRSSGWVFQLPKAGQPKEKPLLIHWIAFVCVL
eukprot:RCo043297